MLRAPDTENLIIGKGKLYFAPIESDVNMGEIDLGNAPSFTLTPLVERLPHFSAREGVRKKDFNPVVEVGAMLAATLEEFNAENLNLAFLGPGVESIAQGSGTVSNEAKTARLDRWVKLDYRMISSVVIKNAAETVTYTVEVDYLLDADTGRFLAKTSGSITEAENLKISYTYAAWSKDYIRAITNPTVEGQLRFIGTGDYGPKMEVVCHKVQLALDGELPLISEEIAQFNLSGEVLDDTENHPNDPFYQVIYLED